MAGRQENGKKREMEKESELEYAGFRRRGGATLIDTFLLCIVSFPLLGMLYGPDYRMDERLVHGSADFAISWILPAAIVLVFRSSQGARPGKMAIAARVVDQGTGCKPSTGQLTGRYCAYSISALPLRIGFLRAGFNPRKPVWHDTLLSGTVAGRREVDGAKPLRLAQPDGDSGHRAFTR